MKVKQIITNQVMTIVLTDNGQLFRADTIANLNQPDSLSLYSGDIQATFTKISTHPDSQHVLALTDEGKHEKANLK